MSGLSRLVQRRGSEEEEEIWRRQLTAALDHLYPGKQWQKPQGPRQEESEEILRLRALATRGKVRQVPAKPRVAEPDGQVSEFVAEMEREIQQEIERLEEKKRQEARARQDEEIRQLVSEAPLPEGESKARFVRRVRGILGLVPREEWTIEDRVNLAVYERIIVDDASRAGSQPRSESEQMVVGVRPEPQVPATRPQHAPHSLSDEFQLQPSRGSTPTLPALDSHQTPSPRIATPTDSQLDPPSKSPPMSSAGSQLSLTGQAVDELNRYIGESQSGGGEAADGPDTPTTLDWPEADPSWVNQPAETTQERTTRHDRWTSERNPPPAPTALRRPHPIARDQPPQTDPASRNHWNPGWLPVNSTVTEPLASRNPAPTSRVEGGPAPPASTTDRPPSYTEATRGGRSHAAREPPARMIRTGTMFGGDDNPLAPIPVDQWDPPRRTCFICWEEGHQRWACRYPDRPDYCRNCGRNRVRIETCPRCSTAYAKWGPTAPLQPLMSLQVEPPATVVRTALGGSSDRRSPLYDPNPPRTDPSFESPRPRRTSPGRGGSSRGEESHRRPSDRPRPHQEPEVARRTRPSRWGSPREERRVQMADPLGPPPPYEEALRLTTPPRSVVPTCDSQRPLRGGSPLRSRAARTARDHSDTRERHQPQAARDPSRAPRRGSPTTDRGSRPRNYRETRDPSSPSTRHSTGAVPRTRRRRSPESTSPDSDRPRHTTSRRRKSPSPTRRQRTLPPRSACRDNRMQTDHDLEWHLNVLDRAGPYPTDRTWRKLPRSRRSREYSSDSDY